MHNFQFYYICRNIYIFVTYLYIFLYIYLQFTNKIFSRQVLQNMDKKGKLKKKTKKATNNIENNKS